MTEINEMVVNLYQAYLLGKRLSEKYPYIRVVESKKNLYTSFTIYLVQNHCKQMKIYEKKVCFWMNQKEQFSSGFKFSDVWKCKAGKNQKHVINLEGKLKS